jgi:LAO/AO transport system kinase
MTDVSALLSQIHQGDFRSLARAISLVENELDGSEELLEKIPSRRIPVTGITGPPGAGKSSLLTALIGLLVKRNVRVGVITVDPTSPFNFGSLLGDRIRMKEHFNDPRVFIRSVATRGSLGGLSEKIIEVTEVMKAAPFDFLFIETVGVGQSEVDIAGLADTTVIVLVPQGGDEVQTMKAGLMEIADIFVVNKSDHPDSDQFAKSLSMLAASKSPARAHGKVESTATWQIPVVKTIATTQAGIEELLALIEKHHSAGIVNERQSYMLTEKVWRLIAKHRMKNVDRKKLQSEIQGAILQGNFNAFRFAKSKY